MTVEKKEIKPEMRFSEKELSLVRNTFADNDKLLKAIRKVFWQREISEEEKLMIGEMNKGDEIKAVIRKFFLPELDGDTPILQMIDLWLSLEFKQMNPEEAEPHIIARDRLIQYLDQQLKVLFNEYVATNIEFDFGRGNDREESYIGLLFRNTAVIHIDQCLMQIKVLANEPQETPEEMMARISKDSSK